MKLKRLTLSNVNWKMVRYIIAGLVAAACTDADLLKTLPVWAIRVAAYIALGYRIAKAFNDKSRATADAVTDANLPEGTPVSGLAPVVPVVPPSPPAPTYDNPS